VLPGKVYTPEVVLEIVWRHKWLIILPFAIIATGMAIYTQTLPDVYRSETLIMVVPQRIPDTYVRSTVTARIEDRLRSISEQILSRTRLEQVIVEFGLYPKQRTRLPMEDVVEVMRKQIKVEPVRNDMFRIAFVAPDPEVAARVVTKLADMYIAENQRDRTVVAEDTNEFLESQMLDAKARLVEHEKKLEAYRLQHAGELPSQFQANLQMIGATQVQLRALADSINSDRDRRLAFETALAEVKRGEAPSTGALSSLGAPTPNALDPLDAARAELRELQRRLTANHPDVEAKQRQVAELEEQARNRPAPTPAVAEAEHVPPSAATTRVRQIQAEIDKLDAQLQTKEAEEARLNEVIADYRRRVEAVPTRETEMTELMRDYATLQTTYTNLLGAKQSSAIAANLERRQIGEQFKVLDPARPAERPFSPNRLQLNLFGALAGLGLGLALIALVEYRDTTFRTEEDILQVLALPVLAVIPFMESPQEQRRRRLKVIVTSVAGVAALAVTVAILAISYDLTGWFGGPQ
jgi:polysaccharide chain length determinant protein (PEP-CTERM system associated)